MNRPRTVWAIRAGIFLAVVLIVTLGGAWWAIRRVPAFYRIAAAAPLERAQKSADQFEHNVLELHNETVRPGQWQVEWTEDEINGWLAAKLPQAFPHLLPSTIHNPRVQLAANQLTFAYQFENSWVSTVVNVALEPYVVEGKNTLAIRVRGVHAGNLPLPLKGSIEVVTNAARQADVQLRWSHAGGDPVALIEVESFADKRHHLQLDGVIVQPGKLIVRGRTTNKNNLPTAAP